MASIAPCCWPSSSSYTTKSARLHTSPAHRIRRRASSLLNVTAHSTSRDSPVKIKVDNLWKKSINGEKILEGISFEVKQAQIYGLIGPSGSGKSTVLRALNRLWEPPPSTVFLDDQDVTDMDPITLRKRVGMLFQSSYMFPGTVAYNVQYGPSLRGIQLSMEEIEHLLSLAGFYDLEPNFLEKSVSDLSGGEAQRVALARALANKPEVLLLDEPTSSLDPVSTRIVENTILQLREANLTVVMVSHSLDQVERIVDIASVFYQGSLLETGPLSELRKIKNGVLAGFFS